MNINFIEPNPTMKLDGGIDTYSMEGKRYCTDEPPRGRKVVYLNENGCDADREYANQYFKEGQILTVFEIYVGRSSSQVEFEEVPGRSFNTAMFADVDEDLLEEIEIAERIIHRLNSNNYVEFTPEKGLWGLHQEPGNK